VHLCAGLKNSFVPLVVVFAVVIIFSSSFILLSSNMVPLTTASLSDSNSTDNSTVPVPLWNYTTDSQVNSPVIFAQGILYFATEDRSIYAINAASGTTLWTLDGYCRFPVVDNGKIFCSYSRIMYALDAYSGTKLWEQSVSTSGGTLIIAPSVVANDILYVCLESGLRALDVATGDMLWHYSDIRYVTSSPLVVDDVVYVVGSYNTVYAFDAQSDRKIWTYTVGSKPWDNDFSVSSFVSDDGLLYFCVADGNVYALDAGNGQEIWRYTYTSDRLRGYPFLNGGLIYVVSNKGDVCALNATDGTKIWSAIIGESGLSVPAFYEGVLYFSSSEGNLFALNATSGFELWRYPISHSFTWARGVGGGVGSPVVCDGVLYVGCDVCVFALAVSPSFVLPSLPPSTSGSFLFGLSVFSIFLVVGVAVVIVVCCVWLYLFKKRNRLKPNL